MFSDEKGQSLVELVVAMTVVTIVVGALTFATISSLRNAHGAKNQSQGTRLAQEGLEKVRSGRDRGSIINFGSSTKNWRDDTLWTAPITNFCGSAPCYFKLQNSTELIWVGNGSTFNFITSAEKIDNQFYRAIIVSDTANYAQEKEITAIVKWTDFAGEHESRLKTILRNPRL